eukprot:scaffold281896_cov34-Tisochrysis_lutea.AAC.5
MDRISIGSPRAVPVPWASQVKIEAGVIAASVSVAWRSCCCALPLGAVRLALRPSWRTQLPSDNTPCASEEVTLESVAAQHASPRA